MKQTLYNIYTKNPLLIDFKLILSRFALTFDFKNSHSINSNVNLNSKSNSSFTFSEECSLMMVLYGFQYISHQGISTLDGLLNIRLGAIRIFGNDGIELLSCGQYTDEWFHDYNISDVSNKDLALSIQYNWSLQTRKNYSQVNSLNDQSYLSTNNYHNLIQKLYKYHTLEMSMNILKLKLNFNSLNNILSILSWWFQSVSNISSFNTSLLNNNNTNNQKKDINQQKNYFSFDLNKSNKNLYQKVLRKISEFEKNKAMSTISTSDISQLISKDKWNINIVTNGLIIQIPVNNSLRKSQERFQRTNLPSTTMNSKQSYFEIVIGLSTIHCGDFLTNSLNPRFHNSISTLGNDFNNINNNINVNNDLNSPLENNDILNSKLNEELLWCNKDKFIQNRLKNQNPCLLQSILCKFEGIEFIGHFPHHTTKITDKPFNFQIFMTLSTLPSHFLFPDLSIDLFLSPILLSFTSLVSISLIY